MKLSIISPEQCLALRQEVLRNGKPLNLCTFEGDYLKSTYHLGAFKDNKLIGILSLFNTPDDNFKKNIQYQLRGVAIQPKSQGLGIGKKLIEAAENKLKAKNVELLWCNARISSLPFYHKLGYKNFGEEFDIKDVGPHLKLYKQL